MSNIKPKDRVKAVSGHFKDKRGYVTRTDSNQACVVWKNVWAYGIWVNKSELKRTKRYNKE